MPEAQAVLTDYLYQRGTTDDLAAKQAADLIAYMNREGFVFCKTTSWVARGRCVIPTGLSQ